MIDIIGSGGPPNRRQSSAVVVRVNIFKTIRHGGGGEQHSHLFGRQDANFKYLGGLWVFNRVG
jgi:hypothetical protein